MAREKETRGSISRFAAPGELAAGEAASKAAANRRDAVIQSEATQGTAKQSAAKLNAAKQSTAKQSTAKQSTAKLSSAKRDVLLRAADFARSVHEGDASGHDWPHIERVVRMARQIGAAEGADLFVCELAALLHDVADRKLNPSKEAGQAKVEQWLEREPIEASVRYHVLDIISKISYSAGPDVPMRTVEGRVVRDADRLDAIGAIAIARTFAYAGWRGQPIHDPQSPPRTDMTSELYRGEHTTAINHFYEKLLKLKSLLHTDVARAIAEERHRFMESYLERFYMEWDGEA